MEVNQINRIEDHLEYLILGFRAFKRTFESLKSGFDRTNWGKRVPRITRIKGTVTICTMYADTK